MFIYVLYSSVFRNFLFNTNSPKNRKNIGEFVKRKISKHWRIQYVNEHFVILFLITNCSFTSCILQCLEFFHICHDAEIAKAGVQIRGWPKRSFVHHPPTHLYLELQIRGGFTPATNSHMYFRYSRTDYLVPLKYNTNVWHTINIIFHTVLL